MNKWNTQIRLLINNHTERILQTNSANLKLTRNPFYPQKERESFSFKASRNINEPKRQRDQKAFERNLVY